MTSNGVSKPTKVRKCFSKRFSTMVDSGPGEIGFILDQKLTRETPYEKGKQGYNGVSKHKLKYIFHQMGLETTGSINFFEGEHSFDAFVEMINRAKRNKDEFAKTVNEMDYGLKANVQINECPIEDEKLD
jgi:hypothetical protein